MTTVETTALAVRPSQVAYLSPQDALKTGEILAKSNFFADARDASRAAAKILMGQELGLSPMASMKNIYVLDGKNGKVTFMVAAATQLALVRQSGKYDYKVLERSTEKASIRFDRIEYLPDGQGGLKRNVLDSDVMTYTREDAVIACAGELRATYQAHPKNMLFWRCVTNGVQAYCPDVLSGPFYTEGEFGDQGLPLGDSEVATVEARVVSSETVRKVAPVASKPTCVTGPELLKAVEKAERRVESVIASVQAEQGLLISAAPAAAPVEPAPSTVVAATSSAEEASLDRTAAALGIKAGEGPLAPDPLEGPDAMKLGALIPTARARALTLRILALAEGERLSKNDAKDVNNYLKELMQPAGARSAWKAVLGDDPKPGVEITRSQVFKLASLIGA